MARPKHKYPKPHLEKRGDSWRIRWWAFESFFTLTLGKIEKRKADALYHFVSLALSGQGDWPDELAGEPTVRLYRQRVAGDPPEVALPTTAAELIDAYYEHLKKKSASLYWPKSVRSYLQRFFDHAGTPDNITTRTILEFLDAMVTKADLRYRRATDAEAAGRKKKRRYKSKAAAAAAMAKAKAKARALAEVPTISNASRNRARTAISGLCSWMRVSGHRPRNWDPLFGIGELREERPHDGVVIWEDDELRPLLEAADRLSDGIAIWIAVYAGLRRAEIARLEWSDITPAYITVRKSKTGRKRQVPLSSQLLERLEREPKTGTKVVNWPEAWFNRARNAMEERLPREIARHDGDDSKRVEMIRTLHQRHPEKFGWNIFRHTFASRLAQAGRPLDLIAAWLGDSPSVCRDHYTRFVPQNRRDDRIDDVNLPTGA